MQCLCSRGNPELNQQSKWALRKHTKIYLKEMNYYPTDWIPCEVCEQTAVDIHHIEARGMGGGNKDTIENLMALCRKCHVDYGDRKQYKGLLMAVHDQRMKRRK
jgi:5-methylcytosine-specific restriction endonuclease McrA